MAKNGESWYFEIASALFILIIYFIAGKIGLSLAFVNSSSSAVWAPTGVAIAFLLILGRKFWPVIALGAFIVNYTTTGIIPTSVAIGIGNVMEAYVAAYLITKFAGGIRAFESWINIIRFTIVGALIPTIISATVGIVTLLAGGLAEYSTALATWGTWWIGDITGALLFTPVIVLLYRNRSFNFGERLLEKAVTAILIVLVTAFVFTLSFPYYKPGAYLCMVIIGFVAFRYSPRETAFAGATISIISVWSTLSGMGPFYVVNNPNISLILVQSFAAIITVAGLVLSAAVISEERTKTELLAERKTLDLQVKYMAARMLEGTSNLDQIFESSQIGFLDMDITKDTGVRNLRHDLIYGHEYLLQRWNMKTFYEHILPDDKKRVQDAFKRAYKTGDLKVRCKIFWPDASVHWIEIRGHIFFDDKNKPFRMLSTVVDITNEKKSD